MSKPHHFTKTTPVTGKISIWAFPNTLKEIKEGGEPFRFELRDSKMEFYFQEDATKICSDDVTLTMPGGIDLLAKTIETLNEKKKRVLAAAQKEAIDIQEKINGLLMLTHQPDPIRPEANVTIIMDDEVHGDAKPAPIEIDSLPF